jgi:hypothetical protein
LQTGENELILDSKSDASPKEEEEQEEEEDTPTAPPRGNVTITATTNHQTGGCLLEHSIISQKIELFTAVVSALPLGILRHFSI